MSTKNELALALINRFQHGMPICARPYENMAQTLGCTEQALMDCLDALDKAGILSRIGPVFEHRRAGASTLAALSVPQDRMQEVAGLVSQFREVNHNYERDGEWNLWFVVTASSQSHLDEVIESIEKSTGLTALNLPMLKGFHIDLGFPIDSLGDKVLA